MLIELITLRHQVDYHKRLPDSIQLAGRPRSSCLIDQLGTWTPYKVLIDGAADLWLYLKAMREVRSRNAFPHRMVVCRTGMLSLPLESVNYAYSTPLQRATLQKVTQPPSACSYCRYVR